MSPGFASGVRTEVKLIARPMPPRSANMRRLFALSRKMSLERALSRFSQPRGALLDQARCDGRHARGRRLRSRREWKHMQMREPAFVDQIERVLKHVFGFGRETDDEIGAKDTRGRAARISWQNFIASARE